MTGTGTQSNPYIISTPSDLNDVRNNRSGYYQLANDIDMGSYGNFTPIGDSSVAFTGNFDGKGYAIYNLTVNRSTTDYNGLFGYLSTGCVIKDLNLYNVKVTGQRYNGGLAGYSNTATIDKVRVTGAIVGATSGNAETGGLIGKIYGGTLQDCISHATTSCYSYGGGFAGYAQNGTYRRCHATGAVSCTNTTYRGGWGYASGGSGYDCFFDNQTTTLTTSGGTAKATGKTTAEMKTQSTFTNHDFTNIWRMNGYPIQRSLVPAFSGGTGVSGDPFLIADAADLDGIRKFMTGYYKLTSDIDLSGVTNWTPLGTYSTMNGIADYFTGTLDGDGHRITNITINRTVGYYAGLIGITNTGAVITNLGVEGSSSCSHATYGIGAGLISGYLYNATISKCYAKGTVYTSLDNAGGIAGHMYGASSATDCYADVNVDAGRSNAGGLLGGLGGGTVATCYSVGDVDAVTSNAGGFIGNVSGTTTINACYFDTQTSGKASAYGTGTPTSGSGTTGKTTAQMQTQSTFTGWNFTTIWSMDGYPVLQVFPSPAVSDYATLSMTSRVVISVSDTIDMFENIIPSGQDYLSINERITTTGTSSLSANERILTTGFSADLPINENIQNSVVELPINERVVIQETSLLPSNENVVYGDSSTIEMLEQVPAGTQADPYHIKTYEDLLFIGTYKTSTDYFVLDNDIDTSGHIWNTVLLFSGHIDGQGHSIQNLTRPLIGTLKGSITNLGLVDVNIVVNYDNVYSALVNLTNTGASISNCYAAGYIENTNTGTSNILGGLVGQHQTGSISNCYSRVRLKGAYKIGGFVGVHTGGTISNCFAAAKIEKIGTATANGFGDNASVTSCYWDKTVSTITTSVGGTGKTTAEMKMQATFSGYDFTNIWQFIDGRYPFLRTQAYSYTSLIMNETVILGGSELLALNERVAISASAILPVNMYVMTDGELRMFERIMGEGSATIGTSESVKTTGQDTLPLTETVTLPDTIITDLSGYQDGAVNSFNLGGAQWLSVDSTVSRTTVLPEDPDAFGTLITLGAGQAIYINYLSLDRDRSGNSHTGYFVVDMYESDGTTYIKRICTTSATPTTSVDGTITSSKTVYVKTVVCGLDRTTKIKITSAPDWFVFTAVGSTDLTKENADSAFILPITYPSYTSSFQFNYVSNYGEDKITIDVSLDNGATWSAADENQIINRNFNYTGAKIRFKSNTTVSTPISLNSVRINFIEMPSSMLTTAERVIVSTSSALPITEGVYLGADSATIPMLEQTIAGETIPLNERIVILSSRILPMDEVVYNYGEPSTIPTYENVTISDGAVLPMTERTVISSSATLPMNETTQTHDSSLLPLNERVLTTGTSSMYSDERVLGVSSSTIPSVENIDIPVGDRLPMVELIKDSNISVLSILSKEVVVQPDVTITNMNSVKAASNSSLYLNGAQWLCVNTGLALGTALSDVINLSAGDMRYIKEIKLTDNPASSAQTATISIVQYESDGTTPIKTWFTRTYTMPANYQGWLAGGITIPVDVVIPSLGRATVLKILNTNSNVFFDWYGTVSDLSVENTDSNYDMSLSYPSGAAYFQFNYTSNYGKSSIITEASVDDGDTWVPMAENEIRTRDFGYSKVKIRFRANVSTPTNICINSIRVNFNDKSAAYLASVEKVLRPDESTVAMKERTAISSSDNAFNANEYVLSHESSTLGMTERTLGVASASIVAREFTGTMIGSGTIPTAELIFTPESQTVQSVERILTTASASLAMTEYPADDGSDTVTLAETVMGRASSLLRVSDRVVDLGANTIIVNERIYLEESVFKAMVERVLTTGSDSVSMTENLVYGGSDNTLHTLEYIKGRASATLEINEFTTATPGDSSITMDELVYGQTFETISVKERIKAPNSDNVDTYEYVADDGTSSLSTTEEVKASSSQAINVTERVVTRWFNVVSISERIMTPGTPASILVNEYVQAKDSLILLVQEHVRKDGMGLLRVTERIFESSKMLQIETSIEVMVADILTDTMGTTSNVKGLTVEAEAVSLGTESTINQYKIECEVS